MVVHIGVVRKSFEVSEESESRKVCDKVLFKRWMDGEQCAERLDLGSFSFFFLCHSIYRDK